MQVQEFPKWKYHRTLPACMVNDAEQEAALGAGWADTPAAFTHGDEGKAEPVPEAPAELAAPEPKKKRSRS